MQRRNCEIVSSVLMEPYVHFNFIDRQKNYKKCVKFKAVLFKSIQKCNIDKIKWH